MSVLSSPSVVSLAGARELATPAAVMRTYAAPSGPSSASVAVWRVDMAADSAGPLHVVTEDQVVVVLSGALRAVVGDAEHAVGPDDSLVLPAGAPRQLTAGPQGATLLVSSLPGALAQAETADPVPVPWAR